MLKDNNKYAKTLLNVCEQSRKVHVIKSELESLARLYNKVAIFRFIFNTKQIDSQNKVEIISNALHEFDPLIIELLSIIITDGQANRLLDVISKFNRLSQSNSEIRSIDVE